MHLLNFIKNTFQKRAASPNVETVWPYGSGLSYGSLQNLPVIRRCVSVYSQFLNILSLETKSGKSHYIFEVLKRPHPLFSKSDFYQILCWETLIRGQFIARLKYDFRGHITKLFPFTGGRARGFPFKGDYGDTESLDQNGYFFQSFYSGKRFMPDEALHIRDCLPVSGDLINGVSRISAFKTAFETARSVHNMQAGYADSGGRGPVLVTGVPLTNSDQDKIVRERAQKLLQSGLRSGSNQVMAMPKGYTVERLLNDQGGPLITWLSEQSEKHIAQVFDIPFPLIEVGKTSIQPLKEITRHFIRVPLRNFLDKVAQALSKAVGDGTEFYFNPSKFRFSDAREAGLYFDALVNRGIMTPAEVKKELEENL